MFFSRDLKGENAAVDSGTESLQSVLSQKNIHICLWSDGTRDSFGNIVPKFAAGLGDIKAVAKNCDFFKQLFTRHPLNEKCDEIPSDKFFPSDYRRPLSRREGFQVAYFLEILADQPASGVYYMLVKDKVRYISVKMPKHESWLAEDAEMMLGMLNLAFRNTNNTRQEQSIFCCRLSMFLCSLSEKLPRMFYCHLTGDNGSAYMTPGELLNTKKVLADAFGCSHIRSIAYFLTSTPGIKLDRNYRNSLAHWYSLTFPKNTP